ncbi:hypothetical protein ACFY3G_02775 [Streptomyces phaeochromogenes]|uniref:hypothetical protein n=1 Tax=Streptomyces phaeochromogenes TaxID=1923 RepID=UPI0036B4E9BB
MSLLGADELRVRHFLSRLDARPFGHPEILLMNDTQPQPGRPRDWLDDFLDGTTKEPAPPPEPEPEPSKPRPWYSVGKQAAEQPAQPAEPSQVPGLPPGLHITFTPPPTAPSAPSHQQQRRSRIRRWLLAHGAAAGTGWTFGLYHSIAAFLAPLGPGAPGAGLALAGMFWVLAALFTERIVARYVPSDQLRAAAAWALRIPFATALLATALHAPNAHL